MLTERPFISAPHIKTYPRWLRFAPLVLAGMVLLIYCSSLRVYFLSDDYVLLTQAQVQSSFGDMFVVAPRWFFYRPLGKLWWWAEYHAFGSRGVLYHAFSLGLHLMNGALVAMLARRYLNAASAVIAGVLFVALPLHVETVVWLACQYDLVATCGYLVALLCLLKWFAPGNPGQPAVGRPSPVLWYLLAIAAFQVSLWSKEVAFTMPFVGMSLALLLPERPTLRRVFVSLIPFLILLGLNLLQRYLTWGSLGGYSGVSLRLDTLPSALIATAGTLLAPLNQLVFPPWLVRVWAIVVACVLIAGTFWLRDRRPVLVALVWLALTLVPVLGLLPPGADMQNSRTLYLPAVGMCLWLATASSAFFRQAGAPISMALVVACAAALPWQIEPWRVAGNNSIHIVQELHRLMPSFPARSTLTAVDLPDNYKGAYIYRLGLDHSFGFHYKSTFALEQAPRLPMPRYGLAGDSAQVWFGFNPRTELWEVVQARRIARESIKPMPGWHVWNMAACPKTWQSDVACVAGTGVQLNDRGSLESVQLPATPMGWVEVAAEIEASSAARPGDLHMFWRGTSGEWISSEAAHVTLAADGSKRTYHFFLNPSDGGQPVGQIRFDFENAAGALVRAIAIRRVP